MNSKWLGAGVVLMLLASGAVADVYKWKDASGRVRYSDMPPAGNVPYQTLSGKKPAPAPSTDTQNAAPKAPAAENTPSDKEEAAKKRQADAEAAKKKEEEQLAEKQLREKNCATAKSNVQTYQQGGRIVRVDEKGERVYLDEATIAKELEQSKKDVEAWCKE